MCIAFPYGRQNALQRGLLSRAWWFIARQPLRLYSFGALFHAMIMLLMSFFGYIELNSPAVYTLGTFAVFGVTGWLLLGYILQIYPRWFRCSAVEYANYGMAYNLAFVALLMAEIGQFNHVLLNVVGYILLALGWLVSLHAIRWMYQWGYGVKQTVAPYVASGLQIALWLIIVAIPVSLFSLSLLGKLLFIVSGGLIVMLIIGLLSVYFQVSHAQPL